MNKEEHFEENWEGFIKQNPQLSNNSWLKKKFKMFYDVGYSKGIMT